LLKDVTGVTLTVSASGIEKEKVLKGIDKTPPSSDRTARGRRACRAGSNPGPSWQIKATGDFNEDGSADIQWQDTDGTPANWLMNGLNPIGGGVVNSAKPARVINAPDRMT
jgi:hypothetical protein